MANDCFIQGIGVAVPGQSISQSETESVFAPAISNPRTADLFRRVARLTGIQRRYLAALDYVGDGIATPLYQSSTVQPCGPGMGDRTAVFLEAAFPLVKESLSAFTHEQLARVDTLVTVTCTHAASPGLEQPVFGCTPVPHSAQRWNLGFMGCSAGLAALRLVRHADASSARQSLLLACELSSLHFQYTQKLDQLTANLLFADGCAGVLLSSKRSRVRVVDCACHTLPAAANQMVWFAGDHGLQLTLSNELPDTLALHIGPAIQSFLARSQKSLDQIDHWVVHPGGPQILDSMEKTMNLPSDALRWSRDVLRRYGNMSSPTVFFILRELIQAHQAGVVLMAAFGPGLTIEFALLEISDA